MKRFIIDRFRPLLGSIRGVSLKLAVKEQSLSDIMDKLRKIVPDISKQESGQKVFNEFWELKRRGLHAFQYDLMIKAISQISSDKSGTNRQTDKQTNRQTDKLVVADIGDSAGTHMLYLKKLCASYDIETYSVNLDPRAIKKIKDRGLKAILRRAEKIMPEDIGGSKGIDLFTSFEMVEHLHNPAIFFKRIATKMSCNKMVVTVPYLKHSRVGLHHIRKQLKKIIYAEDEHIFELSPEDWTLLFLHSGWKVVYDKIYFQYPKKLPIIACILRYLWRKTDYEGFWGAILEKDLTFAELYKDWEN